MTPRQQAGVARMIVEITEEHRCILSIDDDEVTVFNGHGPDHAHHGGASLYDRMSKALATAKKYAGERIDFEDLRT